MLIKIDGWPGHLDFNTLVEMRLHGVYIFPCVQNTTHVTQETDISYGRFKSLLCQYTQVLLNGLHAEKVKQMEVGINKPIPCLNWSHYGILLSGHAAEAGKQEIPSIFHESFSTEKNLAAWGKNSAVLLTQVVMQNRTIRHEIQEGIDAMDSWWQLEIKLEETCSKLDLLGYNAKVLTCKVRRVNKNSLESRVPASASEEEKIKALAKCENITLLSVIILLVLNA